MHSEVHCTGQDISPVALSGQLQIAHSFGGRSKKDMSFEQIFTRPGCIKGKSPSLRGEGEAIALFMFLECAFCISCARIRRSFEGRSPLTDKGCLEENITVHQKRLCPVAEDLEGAKFVGDRRGLFQIDAELQLIACVAMQNQRVISGLPNI